MPGFIFKLFAILLVWLGSQNVIASGDADFALLRARMVESQILSRGVKDPDVIKAMTKVPRHMFVSQSQRPLSYGDYPLPIGEGQTISQPYIVAFMTEALGLGQDSRVLEIGTGSGYQAAILAEIAKEVFTIEIIEKLGARARQVLDIMGYRNIHVRIGDGYEGWPEKAPFDAIIVTCAPERIPQALINQLKVGGRMILPVGRVGAVQKLVKITKSMEGITTEDLLLVRFVPMKKGRP